VGIVSEVLLPGVQHRECPDASAQMAWIGSDLQQRLGSGPEQQVVKQTLVAECERCQLFWHSEDHMGVGYRQQP
jgi:hypothetical protein